MIIELVAKKYLEKNLDVPVAIDLSAITAEKSFVTIEKTGSRKDNSVITSVLAIQSYGDSMYEASLLNERVKILMDNIAELDDICYSKIETDYNFTDTSTKRYRYQAVYDLVHF